MKPRPSQVDYAPERIAEILDSTKWSGDFTWDQLVKMAPYLEVHSAGQGQVIFKQGENERLMGILIEGTVDVVRDDDGKDTKLVTLKPPQSFGELSLIDGQPRSAWAVVRADVLYLALTKEKLDQLFKMHPTIAYKLLWKISQLLSQRLRRTSGKLVEFISSH